ncbi:MAG: sulfite exporter TauE/SafE family protein, partial [Armatimonadetes bacterium]
MMSILVWVAALMITAGAAAVQGTVGIGFGVISIPILALLHPDLVPVPQLLMALPLTVSMAWRERSAIDLTGVGWVIGGRIPGAFLGVFLLGIASERILDGFIAVVVILAVVVI